MNLAAKIIAELGRFGQILVTEEKTRVGTIFFVTFVYFVAKIFFGSCLSGLKNHDTNSLEFQHGVKNGSIKKHGQDDSQGEGQIAYLKQAR